MTATVNSYEATTVTDGEVITLTTADGQTLKLKADQVTSVTDALLAARKEAYEARRTAKQAERDAAKAEREAKKAERKAAAEAKKAERVKKLKDQLAKLDA